MNGYFGQLLDMWGEKKTEYTADSFFGVFISFYDEFVTELNMLEKKKQDAEEMRKKREAQEKMARSRSTRWTTSRRTSRERRATR